MIDLTVYQVHWVANRLNPQGIAEKLDMIQLVIANDAQEALDGVAKYFKTPNAKVIGQGLTYGGVTRANPYQVLLVADNLAAQIADRLPGKAVETLSESPDDFRGTREV